MELTASDYMFYHEGTATLKLQSWSIILDKLRRNGAAFKKITRTSYEHETDILARRWNRNSLPHGDIFEDVTNFLMQKYANAANALVRNKFTINYNIYGCTIPERVIDTLENTVAFKIHMEWRKMAIDIKMVAGVGTPMTFKPEIMKMITAGFLDRYEFARRSNMEPDSIKNMNQNKNHLLLDVLKTALGDQNLLTRLVKGVLLVLDLEESGPQKIIGDIQSLPFTLEGLLSMYYVENAAFVYSSVPLSSKHNFMLYQMCMSYPNQAIKTSNAHIKIPADGDVYLVLDFSLDQKMEVYMTAKEAWESLITYATNMNVLPEVEKAMVIASSLSQNRYVLNASLPNVVSGANLVRPLMMPPNLSAPPQPSMITMNMSKIAGRIHQMSILSSVKHVIIAAENISKDGWQKFVSMLLRNQRNQIMDVEYQNSSPDLLRNTLDFDWSSRLTSRGIYHIANLSILEGLWIYNNCSNHIFGKVPTHYGFCAKSLGSSSIYNTAVEELRKAGVDELGNMPKRDFTIDSPCISMETVKKVEDYFEIMDDIEEFNFGGKEKNEVTETAKK